jgi:hypothetical protein
MLTPERPTSDSIRGAGAAASTIRPLGLCSRGATHVFFPLFYAIAVWAICIRYRRQWPAFIAPIISIGPVALLTYLELALLDLLDAGGEPVIYIFSGAFSLLMLGVGLLIAIQPREVIENPCPSCNYEMEGVEGDICPECGADVTAERPRRTRQIGRDVPQGSAPERSLGTQLAGAGESRRARERVST